MEIYHDSLCEEQTLSTLSQNVVTLFDIFDGYCLVCSLGRSPHYRSSISIARIMIPILILGEPFSSSLGEHLMSSVPFSSSLHLDAHGGVSNQQHGEGDLHN